MRGLLKKAGAAVRRWRAARRRGSVLPVQWVRRAPDWGVLWVVEARRVAVPLELSEGSVLELADALERDPGLRRLELEVELAPGVCQRVYLGPRLLPWVRCVVGAVAQELRYARALRQSAGEAARVASDGVAECGSKAAL